MHRNSLDHVDSDHAKGICFAGFAEALESQFPKSPKASRNCSPTTAPMLARPRKPRSCWAERDSIARWAMREAAPETRTSLDRARSLIERAEALGEPPEDPVAAVETNDQPKDGCTSGYDAEIAEAIGERVVSGESLRTICVNPAMPARATVFRWLASNQEFRQLSWTGTEVVYSN